MELYGDVVAMGAGIVEVMTEVYVPMTVLVLVYELTVVTVPLVMVVGTTANSAISH